MRVTALVIAEGIGVVPAEHLERLFPLAQMHFGDTARTRFTVGDHGLPIGMQVVMGICASRRSVISLGIVCTIWGTPTAKALHVIAQSAAVKTDPPSVTTPKFVLVPFASRLSWNWLTLSVCNVE